MSVAATEWLGNSCLLQQTVWLAQDVAEEEVKEKIEKINWKNVVCRENLQKNLDINKVSVYSLGIYRKSTHTIIVCVRRSV